MAPVCGCSTEGLWFRRDVEWERVPAPQRCGGCTGSAESPGSGVVLT